MDALPATAPDAVVTVGTVTRHAGYWTVEAYEVPAGFAMAAAESDGFFRDIRDSDWERYKARPRLQGEGATWERYRQTGSGGWYTPHVWYQMNWDPGFTCAHERRIGGNGDGPKWVCDPHRIDSETCLVYSVGSDNDFTFENTVLSEISANCEVHTFDPTTGPNPSNKPDNVHFHPWGLGKEGAAVPQCRVKSCAGSAMKTMPQVVQELGHVGRRIDIFKIDCEGCEFDTFDAWFGEGVYIHQIQVELHAQGVEIHLGRPKAHSFMLEMARRGYEIFHKEPNTLGCKGSCIEYAFVKLNPAFRDLDAINETSIQNRHQAM